VVLRRWLTLGCAVLALPVAACSPTAAQPGAKPRVVSSTDVYASIVRAIAGDHAELTTFIDNPAQDPHSYQATARDELAISRADIVIENGGGYDDFVDRMRTTVGAKTSTLITVLALSRQPAARGSDPNEHVWYDFPTVARLATRLRDVLTHRDRSDRALFARNTARFLQRLRGLARAEARLRAGYAGEGVAITEPVPLYLLQACGLVDKTPTAFSDAVADDTGVAADVLQQTLDLFGSGAVHALVYNAQTSGPETSQVIAAARAHDVPVVPVTETLPAGRTYLSWMRGNLTALSKALRT
jgi:zinc/manganese transport system substrate-binding protein